MLVEALYCNARVNVSQHYVERIRPADRSVSHSTTLLGVYFVSRSQALEQHCRKSVQRLRVKQVRHLPIWVAYFGGCYDGNDAGLD